MAQRLALRKAAVKYQLLPRTTSLKNEHIVKKVRSLSSHSNCYWKISSPSLLSSSALPSSASAPSCQKRYIRSSSRWNTEAKAPSDDVDECPEWQNPLHHNDPNKTKIMLDQFGSDETPEMVPLPPIDDGSCNVLAPPHIHDLADQIVHLNMLEIKELVDNIGEHFGIEDDDGAMDFGGGGSADGGQEEEVKEERTAFDLKLTGFDAKSKIKVIKEVRAITSLGLKDAKALVDGAPNTVKTEIKMEEAEELKAKLEAVGATVEIV
eukprot:CAMPEP_0197831354 /NCGR_PEP_ID=MMETSP1437-20131217/9569_1 /TAXON_ID=49252 ORGANISM="Eucampia antarctica, Strain CCMP1452" /NCGR_SAMPLE_ID=MMETSP1437 /ASSEMBLY_ACC=CAM_ASM_001096 /LENGTH=264 /DNA_ID=CAMNT_0043434231 /DNA_START=24 /DNA_END=818 /DNA_ORIENTATION=-